MTTDPLVLSVEPVFDAVGFAPRNRVRVGSMVKLFVAKPRRPPLIVTLPPAAPRLASPVTSTSPLAAIRPPENELVPLNRTVPVPAVPVAVLVMLSVVPAFTSPMLLLIVRPPELPMSNAPLAPSRTLRAPVAPFFNVSVFVDASSSSGTETPRPPFSSSVLGVAVLVVFEIDVVVPSVKVRSSMFNVVAVMV